MSDKIIITRGEYVASAVCPEQYPAKNLWEFVFIGRSNVGKSSLINSLTRQKNLARVSSQPGKTQTINFFELTAKIDGERYPFYLVDLPGYGYAKTSKKNRSVWAKFIEEYLLSSRRIAFVCQLIDSRHELMPLDEKMFRWLVSHELAVLPIATKTDKLSKGACDSNIAGIKKALGIPKLDILPYSAIKNEGRSELLDVIASVLVK